MPGVSEAALSGFDQVAFFTDKMPVNSNFQIASMHKGVTYYFKNKGNKKLFWSNPDKYAPQTEGLCTFGASVGALFPVDLSNWQVFKENSIST
jgi:YHS domain-containing protein